MTSLPETAATVLLLAVIAIATLYPEAYAGGIDVASNELLPLVAFMPLFLAAAAAYIYVRRRRLSWGAVEAAIAIYTVYLLARNVGGPNMPVLLKYIVYGLGMFWLAALVITIPHCRRLIIWNLVALLGVISLYGIIEYILQQNVIFHSLLAETVPEPVRSIHRAGSSLGHPITFGAFLAQLLPFAALAWYDRQERWLRYAGALAGCLGVLALLLTFSKGGWLAAMFAGALFLLVAGRQVKSKIIIPVLVLIVLGTVFVPLVWQSAITELVSSNRAELSFEGRRVAWAGALSGIAENPLVGVGLKQGQEELRHRVDPVWLEIADIQLPVDNYYLTVLLEEGVLGFAAWMALLALIFREGIMAARRRVPGSGRAWALAALASIIAISVNALTFEALLVWPTYTLFWFAAGSLRGLNLPGSPKAVAAGA